MNGARAIIHCPVQTSSNSVNSGPRLPLPVSSIPSANSIHPSYFYTGNPHRRSSLHPTSDELVTLLPRADPPVIHSHVFFSTISNRHRQCVPPMGITHTLCQIPPRGDFETNDGAVARVVVGSRERCSNLETMVAGLRGSPSWWFICLCLRLHLDLH